MACLPVPWVGQIYIDQEREGVGTNTAIVSKSSFVIYFFLLWQKIACTELEYRQPPGQNWFQELLGPSPLVDTSRHQGLALKICRLRFQIIKLSQTWPSYWSARYKRGHRIYLDIQGILLVPPPLCWDRKEKRSTSKSEALLEFYGTSDLVGWFALFFHLVTDQ